MKLYILSILVLFFPLLNVQALSPTSCSEQLRKHSWPIDCLLALEIKKTPRESYAYKRLDLWCRLKSDELLKNKVPPAFFSLYSPKYCLSLGLSQKKQQETLHLLDGRFLNSFL